ncbi:hypothetical protein V3C99_006872 [Haemonchus contortus]
MFSLVQTIVEVLIVIFYISVMLVIVTSKSKTFKNAFFVMFVATGCSDATSLLANSFLRANRQLELGLEFKHIVLFAIVIGSTTYFAHMIGNLLIAINRFSALCLMQKYDQIVRSFYVGFSVIYALVSVIINMRLVLEWYRLSRLQNGSGSKIHEKGLLIYTMFVFFSTMMMCTQQITTGMAAFTSNDELYLWAIMQFFWCNDIMVCIPPISILLLSSELRNIVIDFFRRRKPSTGVISIIPIFMSRSNTHHKN